MSRIALKVLAPVFLMALLSLAAVSTASASVCPGGPGPTCIELRVVNPPVSTNTPFFSDGAIVQTWPTPGVPGCLPDVTPNWPGSLVTMDATAPVAPPIQTCYNNGALWARSGRDVGSMAGSQCINDLEAVSFDAPAGKLFTSVSIELKCLGPATRLHDVQVYYYVAPGVLCEQQLIEPPFYASKPHGAPGVNSYILDTVPSDTLCAAGFKRIEIEPQIGSACSIVNTNDFRTASSPFASADPAGFATNNSGAQFVNASILTDGASMQIRSRSRVQGRLSVVAPNRTGLSANADVMAQAPGNQICGTPDVVAAQVIVIKHVINDNGGTNVAADFTMTVDDADTNPPSFPGAEAPGTTVTVDAGAYTVTETGPSGYTASYSADCTGTIANGETKTCTVTNDDIAPQLIVIKHVINDNGGTNVAADFTMTVDDPDTNPPSFPGAEAPGTTVTVDPGAYTVTETGPSGYTASYSADCTGTIANGETKTCTVTNDDIQPKLIVIKVVSGGPALPSDFDFTVTGGSPSPASFVGAGSPGVTVNLNAGSYSVAEAPELGYTTSYSANCSGSVAAGDVKTCTATNTLQPPTAKIAPTGTTCEQFRGGTAGDLTQVLYNIKANKINSVAPGVFFYYSKVIAPVSGPFVVDVLQSRSPAIWPYIPTNHDQLILWDANCVKVQNVTVGYDPVTGTATITVNGGYSAGAFYHVSVKYDPKFLVGQSTAGEPTVTYTDHTALNGATIWTSYDSVAIAPKK